MRKNVVAGNWKMNTTLEEGVELANQINSLLKGKKVNCDVVICVPFTHLTSVNAVIEPELVKLGAENCSEHEKGAYTGEVSAAMVKSTGATHVILGHSERRQYFGEADVTVNGRLKAGLANGLRVILCVGETLTEREQGITAETVSRQTKIALLGVSAEELKNVIIAYEPVWAIGTGKTATAAQAEEVCAAIRGVVASLYGTDAAEATTIQYGGSMNAGNAAELLSMKNIDGGLIGGASLKSDDFTVIVKAAQ